MVIKFEIFLMDFCNLDEIELDVGVMRMEDIYWKFLIIVENGDGDGDGLRGKWCNL